VAADVSFGSSIALVPLRRSSPQAGSHIANNPIYLRLISAPAWSNSGITLFDRTEQIFLR
jgi:hypothetical protein